MKEPELPSLEMLIEENRPEPPSAFERLRYLCPSRYFRFYMLYDRVGKTSCWLPEGYDA